MTESKPWYLSKTVWGALAAAIASLSSLFGFDFDAGQQAMLVDTVLQVTGAAGAAIALFGRISAKSRLF